MDETDKKYICTSKIVEEIAPSILLLPRKDIKDANAYLQFLQIMQGLKGLIKYCSCYSTWFMICLLSVS